MEKKNKKQVKKGIHKALGRPPGSLDYTGKFKDLDISIETFSYNEDEIERHEITPEEFSSEIIPSGKVNWININGIHDPDFMQKVGNEAGIHSLILEDIMNVDFTGKTEIHTDHVFLTVKILHTDKETDNRDFEQVSFILKKDYLISFQEFRGDIFNNIRQRISDPASRARKKETLYLLYLLLDTVVDQYLSSVVKFSEKLREVEESLLTETNENKASEIIQMRQQWIQFKRNIHPLKEMILKFISKENFLLQKRDEQYFRDLQDHIFYLIDENNSQSEIIRGLMEMNTNNISNHTNEVMRKLTVIATIFIPLTFIAGVYGMNFEFIPETQYQYGYFYALGGMFFVGILMYLYVKKL